MNPTSNYLSFSLVHRDADASPLRAPEADRGDLPRGMPMSELWRAVVARIYRAEAAVAAASTSGNAPSAAAHARRHHHGATVQARTSYVSQLVGEFYLTMPVGNPPQKLTFALDTGSELSWMKCEPACINNVCGRPATTATAGAFAFKKSSSYMTVPCESPACRGSLEVISSCSINSTNTKLCTFVVGYGDGTADGGYISVDSFQLSRTMSRPLVFGCSVVANAKEFESMPGLLGLNAGPFSFTSQLFELERGKLPQRFAHCLPDRIQSLNSPGTLLFGDYKLPSKLSYTPLLPPNGPLGHMYYFVKLEGLTVGKSFIKAAAVADHNGGTINVDQGTIFDSGTAVTHLVSPLYEEMVAEVKQQTKHLNPFSVQNQSDVCYKVSTSTDELPQLVPHITMHFAGNVKLELEDDSLLFPIGLHGNDTAYVDVCLAVRPSAGVATLNIIGNHQQQNYWVEYNLQTFSLGLAKAKCAATNRLN